MFRTIRSLPKNIWLLGLISLVNDSASEMIYPLIPIYLTTVLLAGPRFVGLIEGLAEATAALMKLWSGLWFDRTKKTKKFLLLGYGAAAFARPLLWFAQSWLGVLFVQMTSRFGKGIRTSPRDALLALSIEPKRRGLAFGFHKTMDNIGAVIGPLVAAIYLRRGGMIRGLFLWSLVPAVLTVLLTLPVEDLQESQKPKEQATKWYQHGLSSLPKKLRWYFVAAALFALGNSSNMFLLFRAKELGVSIQNIPILWAAFSFVAAVFSTPLSALSDRWGRGRMMLFGWTAYTIFYILLAKVTAVSVMMLLLFFAGFGLFSAATEGVEKALVADLSPDGLAGTAFGWFNLITGLMLFPSSFLFGWIYQSKGAAHAFYFSAICSFAAIVVFTANNTPSRTGSMT